MRTGRILHISVGAIATLSGFRPVVVQPGVRVTKTELEAVGDALFQHDFQSVVHAASEWHITPKNIVVLRVETQGLSQVAREAGERRCCRRRCQLRLGVGRQYARVIHVGANTHFLPVRGQTCPAVGDVGDVQPHVTGKLPLKGQRPVLVPRQFQSILRHRDHIVIVLKRGIDERRPCNASVARVLSAQSRRHLGETGVQEECWSPSVIDTNHRGVRLESLCRLPNELIEGDA